MRWHTYILLPPVLAFACTAGAQILPNSAPAAKPSDEQSNSTPDHYTETIEMLRAWGNNDQSTDLARLFREGEARGSDLLTACRSEDEQIQTGAWFVLQFLGAPGLASCADLIQRRHGGLLLWTGATLTEPDLERIDHWLAKKRTADGYQCGEDDDPQIDGALVYALILNGSNVSKSLLKKMLAIEEFCTGTDTTDMETLQEADRLIASARKTGHDLKIEPDIGRSIRASAFFLPPEYRESSKVEVVARTENRILLDVSYVCGPLCGRGYYVVLRRDGAVWQYAVIRMMWIS